MKRIARLGIVATASLLCASGAQAVTVINGSFESGIDPGSFTTVGAGDSTSITGWTVASGSVDYIGTYWQPGDANRSIDMSGNEPGSISQTLHGFTVGQQYSLSFLLAGNPDGPPPIKDLRVNIGGFQQDVAFPEGANTRPAMGWALYSLLFTADSTDPLLQFSSLTGGSPFGAALDNVAVSETPLPAALPLFGSALGGWGFLGWLRRRRTAVFA
jgi:choice-of-anchor C domain-containing protein